MVFFLEPLHNSFRKRISEKPKFYFFDPVVVRTLANLTTVPLMPQTNAYGNAVEHFVILEFIRLNQYVDTEFRFAYLRTKDDVVIDLIIEHPGKPLLCVEINSNENIQKSDIRSFIKMSSDISKAEAMCLCRDKYPKQIEHVSVLPWQQGLKQIFTKSSHDPKSDS